MVNLRRTVAIGIRAGAEVADDGLGGGLSFLDGLG